MKGCFLLVKAKLPRGIDNIVSHIENVDNVPLQVPLFTDCNVECEFFDHSTGCDICGSADTKCVDVVCMQTCAMICFNLWNSSRVRFCCWRTKKEVVRKKVHKTTLGTLAVQRVFSTTSCFNLPQKTRKITENKINQ